MVKLHSEHSGRAGEVSRLKEANFVEADRARAIVVHQNPAGSLPSYLIKRAEM